MVELDVGEQDIELCMEVDMHVHEGEDVSHSRERDDNLLRKMYGEEIDFITISTTL